MASATNTPAVTEIIAGGFATFLGFSDPNDAPEGTSLSEGCLVKVDSITDEGFVVVPCDADGVEILNADGFREAEVALVSELSAVALADATGAVAAVASDDVEEPVEDDVEEPVEDDVEEPAADEAGAPAGDDDTFVVETASAKELDNALTEFELAKPKGWATMKITEKRTAFLAAYAAAEEADAAPAPVAAPVAAAAPTKAEKVAAKAAEKASEKASAKAAKDAAKVAAKPAKAVSTAPVLPEPEDEEIIVAITPTASVSNLLAQTDALAAAEGLVKQGNQVEFTLGGILDHIYVTGAYKAVGYDGKRAFKDYVNARLDIDYRKAMYLMKSYRVFAQVINALPHATEDDIHRIGWTKVKELARVSPEQLITRYDEVVNYAVTHNKDEVATFVKTSFENVSTREDVAVKKVAFSFSLMADEAETVTAALVLAKNRGAGDDVAQQFALIAAGWLQTENGGGQTFTLDELKALAMVQHGVELHSATDAAAQASPVKA
jgi:hypothetical protein